MSCTRPTGFISKDIEDNEGKDEREQEGKLYSRICDQGSLAFCKKWVGNRSVRFSERLRPYIYMQRVKCACKSTALGCPNKKVMSDFFDRKHVCAKHSDKEKASAETALRKSIPTTTKVIVLFQGISLVDECTADGRHHAKMQ